MDWPLEEEQRTAAYSLIYTSTTHKEKGGAQSLNPHYHATALLKFPKTISANNKPSKNSDKETKKNKRGVLLLFLGLSYMSHVDGGKGTRKPSSIYSLSNFNFSL